MAKAKATEIVVPKDDYDDFVVNIDPDDPLTDVSGNPGFGFELEGRDKTKKYAWAHNTREGISAMVNQAVGWTPVRYRAGGVCPRGAAGLYEEGELITKADHQLVECSRIKWERSKARRERERMSLRTAQKKDWGNNAGFGADRLAADWSAQGGN